MKKKVPGGDPVVFFEVLILALSFNIDNLAFGFAVGLKQKIPWWAASLIGGMGVIFIGIGMLFGVGLADYLPDHFEKWIAAGIYFGLAVWFAVEEVRHADSDRAREPKQWKLLPILTMGTGIGFDGLGMGLTAGILKYPMGLTLLMEAVMGIGMIMVGATFAAKLSSGILKERTGFFSAGLLVLLAVLTLL